MQVRALPVKSVHSTCRLRSTHLSLFPCQCHLSLAIHLCCFNQPSSLFNCGRISTSNFNSFFFFFKKHFLNRILTIFQKGGNKWFFILVTHSESAGWVRSQTQGNVLSRWIRHSLGTPVLNSCMLSLKWFHWHMAMRRHRTPQHPENRRPESSKGFWI